MEPIPETNEAFDELERGGDLHLRGDLQRLASRAAAQVPGLMGVSLGLVVEDLVLTYVATSLDVGALDGVQYADDGPCVAAPRQGETIQTAIEDLLDEGRWLLFAQSTAAAGIRSTLSIPFRHNGVLTGGVNLYGASTATFDGRVGELSDLFGAWAPGAVANADLSFSTRLEAALAPGRLRGQADVDRAVGVLVGALGLDPGAAEERLTQAAARADVTVFVLARAIADAFETG